jgi:hypothetical protein
MKAPDFHIEYDIENQGNTPAKSVRAECRFRFQSSSRKKKAILSGRRRPSVWQQNEHHTTFPIFFMDHRLETANRFTVVVSVKYYDVFDIPREEMVCWLYEEGTPLHTCDIKAVQMGDLFRSRLRTSSGR